MTYEEYKNNKNEKPKNEILKKILSKLFTIIIFIMLVVTISNYSPGFKNFIIDDVLNSTYDFSKVNKLINNFTTVFKNDNTTKVSFVENKTHEKYLDGVKYIIGENEEIKLKSSGIVTYIGKKDGYNNTIIVQQSDGYYAWYGNVKESIKLYDYIEAGENIGTSSDEYYYALFKDDKPVDLNEG